MAKEDIATYLNDHLAGSVAALNLLDMLIEEHAGKPLAAVLKELKEEISAEQQSLKALMDQLEIAKSSARRASAWLSGKLTEIKLHVDDPAGGEFRLFQALETLGLGIAGKTALWRALAAAAELDGRLQLLNYTQLAQQSEDQRQRVEEMRLAVARQTLTLDE